MGGEASSGRKVACLKVAQEDSSRAGIIPQAPSAAALVQSLQALAAP